MTSAMHKQEICTLDEFVEETAESRSTADDNSSGVGPDSFSLALSEALTASATGETSNTMGGGASEDAEKATMQFGRTRELAVAARAVDTQGKHPRLVLEGTNYLGQAMRYLLPEELLTSKRRVVNAIVQAGFACGAPSDIDRLAEYVIASAPPDIAIYADSDGWHNDCAMFVTTENVFTGTGVFPRVADGPITRPAERAKCDEHKDALKAFADPVVIVVFAAMLAGVLAPMAGYQGFFVALCGMTAHDADCMRLIAESIYGHAAKDLPQVVQAFGASEAAAAVRKADGGTACMRPAAGGKRSRGQTIEIEASPLIIAAVDGAALGVLQEVLPPAALLAVSAGSTDRQRAPAAQVADASALPHYAGALGASIIEHVVKNGPIISKNASAFVLKHRQVFADRLGIGLSEAESSNFLDQIALLRFAMSFAKKYDLSPWTDVQVDAAFSDVADRANRARLKLRRAFESDVIQAIRATASSCEKMVKGRKLILLRPDVFDVHIVAARDKSQVLSFLAERGLLITTKGNPTMYQARGIDPENPKTRKWMYAIDEAVLDTK